MIAIEALTLFRSEDFFKEYSEKIAQIFEFGIPHQIIGFRDIYHKASPPFSSVHTQ